MKDNRNPLKIKLAAAKRLLMWHYLNKPLKLILISEFPKAGGSWFSQMMADALQMPFPRNASPKFESSIMHGHHLYNPNFGKMIAVMRDGRDIMVSAYYHFLIENDRNPPHMVARHRSRVDFENYENIQENLPAFIEYMFNGFAEGRTHFTWSEAVNSFFDNQNVCVVKYEDLLKNAVGELEKAISFLGRKKVPFQRLEEIVDKFSFKSLSKRNKGEENKKSFLRKGIAGDWKNNFSEEACKVFDKYAGNELMKAGYEKDNSWIKNYIKIESN